MKGFLGGGLQLLNDLRQVKTLPEVIATQLVTYNKGLTRQFSHIRH